jgi:ABC-type transport system substrate-binding protein
VGQWGIETPLAWRTVQAEKPLWDCVYDALIARDPKTFEYRPGLATEWKPSNELRTWTFKLRPGVQFHEGWGELTAEDVKFTVEQNLKPDSQGGSAPFFRRYLDRIETPAKHTVVMHFKDRVWEVPSLFTQFVGYQNPISKKYVATAWTSPCGAARRSDWSARAGAEKPPPPGSCCAWSGRRPAASSSAAVTSTRCAVASGANTGVRYRPSSRTRTAR